MIARRRAFSAMISAYLHLYTYVYACVRARGYVCMIIIARQRASSAMISAFLHLCMCACMYDHDCKRGGPLLQLSALFASMRMYLCMYVCTYVYLSTCMCPHTHTNTHTCAHTYKQTRCMCVDTRMHMSTHTYKHNHTHTTPHIIHTQSHTCKPHINTYTITHAYLFRISRRTSFDSFLFFRMSRERTTFPQTA